MPNIYKAIRRDRKWKKKKYGPSIPKTKKDLDRKNRDLDWNRKRKEKESYLENEVK